MAGMTVFNDKKYKDPIAASTLDPGNPKYSGQWTLNNQTGQWTRQDPYDPYRNGNPRTNNSSTHMQVSGGALSGGGGMGRPSYHAPARYNPSTMTFQQALGQLPMYDALSDPEMQARAQRFADLAIDPQKAEAEKGRERAELEHYNQTQKTKAMYGGTDKAIDKIASEREKANRTMVAARGGSGRSGLQDYMNMELSKESEAMRLGLEAQKRAGMEEMVRNHGLTMQHYDAAFQELEKLRGQTAAVQYDQLSDRERQRQFQWDMAKNEIAMGIMDMHLRGEDLKVRKYLEELRSADSRYASELSAWTAQLPYIMQTVDQQARMDLAWAELVGQVP